jgi:predicted PurR-regulated permease PerM
MELNKKTLRRIFLGIVGCIILYWVLTAPERITNIFNSCINVLSPFLAGALLAFILNVPMRAFERRLNFIRNEGARRACGICLTLLSIVLVLYGVIMLIMAAYALPQADVSAWGAEAGCGFTVRVSPSLWMREPVAEAIAYVPIIKE